MSSLPPVSVETRLDEDGVLTVTGLPFRAGELLRVQIERASPNGDRKFPLRGTPYRYVDPFESACPPDDWDVLQ